MDEMVFLCVLCRTSGFVRDTAAVAAWKCQHDYWGVAVVKQLQRRVKR